MATTISARQRKLVQDGAKGVADRWVSDPETGAKSRAKFRSSVKRYSGKEAERERAASPQQRAGRRTIRAEQAATGMMGPPPTTFDEGAIKDWLGKMSQENLQKLSRLTEIAKQGKAKDMDKPAWNKVDRGLQQQAVHVEVHGGNVTVNTGSSSKPPYNPSHTPQRKTGRSYGNDWGRKLARLKDFING